MRAIIVSPTYIDPANRGKLRALAGLGVTLSVAVPARPVFVVAFAFAADCASFQVGAACERTTANGEAMAKCFPNTGALMTVDGCDDEKM